MSCSPVTFELIFDMSWAQELSLYGGGYINARFGCAGLPAVGLSSPSNVLGAFAGLLVRAGCSSDQD